MNSHDSSNHSFQLKLKIVVNALIKQYFKLLSMNMA